MKLARYRTSLDEQKFNFALVNDKVASVPSVTEGAEMVVFPDHGPAKHRKILAALDQGFQMYPK